MAPLDSDHVTNSTKSSGSALLRALIPLGLLVAVGALTAVLAPSRANNLDFFSAAAGVIPVTFLAFVVQYRLYGAFDLLAAQSAEDPLQEVSTPLALAVAFALGLVVVMAVGEFAALHPLATGRAASGDSRIVYVSLVCGFASVGIGLLVGGAARE